MKFSSMFDVNSKNRKYFVFIWIIGLITLLIIYSHHGTRKETGNTSFHLHQDESPVRVSMDDDDDMISRVNPNLPYQYWMKMNDVDFEVVGSCGRLPNIYELKFSNYYWQALRLKEGNYQFYSAHYDTRQITPGKSVRILTMIDRADMFVNISLFCQLWFEGEYVPVIAPLEEHHYIWNRNWHSHQDKKYGPYLLSCKVPPSHENKVPAAVSVVEKECDNAVIFLRVVYQKPKNKKGIAVCVKGLDFMKRDYSIRITEWLEILNLMGVDKVFMYNLQIHPNIQKVLDYYQRLGRIDVRKLTLPEGQPNLPVLQHLFFLHNNVQQCLDEIIPYNDCFYRNMYSFKQIVLLDVDEMIFPRKDNNWIDLLSRVANETSQKKRCYASLSSRNAYFLDEMMPEGIYEDIPPYLHMMQHIFRSQKFTAIYDYVKSFFDTNKVLALHNHFPIHFSQDCEFTYPIPIEYAHMHHYRKTCAVELDCNIYKKDIIKDSIIWKYKDQVIPRVNEVLLKLRLIE